MVRPMILRIALDASLMRACTQEVSTAFPEESGGVWMGYQDTDCVRVDWVIGPGPTARHGLTRFSPDLEWQHDQIAQRYAATGGRSTYLGDWHSHPGAAHGELSALDRSVLGKIIATPEAQCAQPLMAIYWGGPEAWDLTVWRAHRVRRWGLWTQVHVVRCLCTGAQA